MFKHGVFIHTHKQPCIYFAYIYILLISVSLFYKISHHQREKIKSGRFCCVSAYFGKDQNTKTSSIFLPRVLLRDILGFYLGYGYPCSLQSSDGTLFLKTACIQECFQRFLPSASAGLLTGWQVNINMLEGLNRFASKSCLKHHRRGWGVICRQLATQ